MVKKREEDDNDDKKALALKTRDTMLLEMKNNEDDIDENDDNFMYSEMEKKALETEEEEWKRVCEIEIRRQHLKRRLEAEQEGKAASSQDPASTEAGVQHEITEESKVAAAKKQLSSIGF